MSATRRSSRSGRGGGGESTFPTEWSEWEWNTAWKCESRYRHVAATGTESDIEYEYRNSTAVPRGHDSSLPAASTLSTITESSNIQEAYLPDNYTYDVESTTEALAQADLSGGQALDRTYSGHGKPTSAGKFSSYYSGPSFQINSGDQRRIATKNPNIDTEPLHPDFKLHQSWEFKFGRVFKVLWSEPTGSTGTVITGVIKQSKHGEYAYHSIRRFVIVDARQGHCICLPILTYGSQGTLKKGVHAKDHAVIYTGKAPVMKARETITKRAIRMVPISPQHKLDNASRINYAKLYTIEHNVKVHFIGAIAQKYEQQVVTDYNATHQPLPDRPYYAGTSDENTFGYARGADPRYPAPATTSWSTSTANQPHSSSYYSQPSTYGPSTSSYSAPYTSSTSLTYPLTSPQFHTPGYAPNPAETTTPSYSPQATYAIPADHNTESQETYNPKAYEAYHPDDPPAETELPPKETQYYRACDACRYNKSRCLLDTSSTSNICQRCARTDRDCIFTPKNDE